MMKKLGNMDQKQVAQALGENGELSQFKNFIN